MGLVWKVAGLAIAVDVVCRVAKFFLFNCDPKQRTLQSGFLSRVPRPLQNLFFVNSRNVRIFHREIRPSKKPIGIVVVAHGYGEHSGRYEAIANSLAEKGFVVRLIDHEGHGRSEGVRAYVERFSHYVDDLVALAQRDESNLPLFLFGHSMGGLMCLHAAMRQLDRQSLPRLAGVVVAAPPVVPIPPNAALQVVALALSKLFPKLQLTKLPAEQICTDPQIVHAYLNDPLVFTGGFRARLAAEIIGAMKIARDRLASSFPVPICVAHGQKDLIVHPDGSTVWFRTLASDCTDKTLHIFDDLYHEILFEPVKGEQVLQQLAQWMLDRI